MNIIKNDSAISITKSDETKTKYYLFDEYEIHHNELMPGLSQAWHHHEKIWETLYMITGSLTIRWKENEKINEQLINQGDVIEFEKNSHSLINSSPEIVKFLILKQILSGTSKKIVFKNDKFVDEE